MKRHIISLTVLAVWLTVVSCVPAAAPPESNVIIPGMRTSIGTVDSTSDVQVFSYTVTLQSALEQPIYINWIAPVPSGEFAERVITPDLRVRVDKAISSSTDIEVSGEPRFDATGLSTKAEIGALEPFMSGVKVNSERTLALPAQDLQEP